MFCQNCGKELPDSSKFCPSCGVSVHNKDMIDENLSQHHVSVQQQGPLPGKDYTLETSSNREKNLLSRNSPVSELSTNNIDNGFASVVGKNCDYYLSEFKKIEAGEKTKFNWAAFFFNAYLCLYRKCGEIFKKYFLIPIILTIAAGFVTAIGVNVVSFAAITVGGIISAVGSIWAFVNCVRIGKNFNNLYYQHCKQVLMDKSEKQHGTSIVAVLSLFGIIVASVIVSSIISAVLSLSSDISTSGNQTIYLDGEYGVTVDPTLQDGYIYLNFNCNGPDTLKLYFSDEPAEVVDLNYEINPTEDEDVYSLFLYNDEIPDGIEFLQLIDMGDDFYSVSFSMDGEEAVGVMLPFTEENGFITVPVFGTNNQGVEAGLLPFWCSGTYYGDDIYSTITFNDTNFSQFNVFLYRLVGIENCIITSADEHTINFTGNFDIDVGSVSGTLESYNDGESMTLTITTSDWDMLPAGTIMEFYYDYQDENYTNNHNGEDTYGICGIYALAELPANRLFVWEDESNLYISLMNRSENLGLCELQVSELENINDTIYFSSITLQGEEIFGSFDTINKTVDFEPEDSDSVLFSYGFGGIFLKQH